MVEMQFIGDINELCDVQKQFITNAVAECGFQNVNIDLQPVGEANDNYAANVKRITVEKNGKTLKMIVKIAPKSDGKRVFGNTALAFLNEHIMYTKVLPKFTELEKAANIPEKERFKYAVCYGTYMEAPNEIILLEDLSVPGYKILDRFTSFTDENVRLILENFASLHSLSYALKYQEPETFETFSNSLSNIQLLMVDAPGTINMLAQVDADVQILLNDDKYKNAVKNVAVELITQAPELAKFEAISKYSVIQQGDPWTNNIMFRLEDERSVECCIIDYQLSKRNNPVADLYFMIFTCTDHVTRAKHFHEWIDYYHSQLDKRLTKFVLKSNYVYPRDQLSADLRRFVKFFLGQSIVLSTFLLKDTTEALKLKETINTIDVNTTMEDLVNLNEHVSLSNAQFETIKKIKLKIEGLVDSLIEFGYL